MTTETIEKLRFGVVEDPFPQHDNMAGRLCIPYLDAHGQPRALKFRCMLHGDCKAENCVKYLGEESTEPRLYNVVSLVDDTATTLFVTEGELDCAVLTQLGLATVGYPGTGSWRPEFTRAVGPDWNRITVIADGDSAGLGAAKKVAKELKADVIECPAGHDISSLHVSGGEGAVLRLLGIEAEEDPFQPM